MTHGRSVNGNVELKQNTQLMSCHIAQSSLKDRCQKNGFKNIVVQNLEKSCSVGTQEEQLDSLDSNSSVQFCFQFFFSFGKRKGGHFILQ